MSKNFDDRDKIPQHIRDEWDDAHDFDPRDPLFGLSKEALRVGFESHAARANLRTRSMTEAA